MKKVYNKPEMEQMLITPEMYMCLPPSANTDVVSGAPQEADQGTVVF